jgi:hypothetical protein
VPNDIASSFYHTQNNGGDEEGMDVEPPAVIFGATQNTHQVTAMVQPDGLLLYVAEAAYESGTSPLSNWIPIVSYEDEAHSHHTQGQSDQETKQLQAQGEQEGPLAIFERYVIVGVPRYRTDNSSRTQTGSTSATKEWGASESGNRWMRTASGSGDGLTVRISLDDFCVW